MSLIFIIALIWIVSDCLIFGSISAKQFFDKEFLQVYIESEDLNGIKSISEEPIPIGELKSSDYDRSKEAYRYELKHMTKTEICWCPYSFEKMKGQFKYMKYLYVKLVLDALRTPVPLEKPRKEELNYKWYWQVYLLFLKLFNYKYGLIISPVLMMFICGLINQEDVLFVLLGGLFGIVLSLTNGILYEKGVIKPKKDTIIIKTENWLYPIESSIKYIDVYEVEYDIERQNDKTDGTTEVNIDHIGNLEDLEGVKKKTIKGYEKLYELQTDVRIKNLKFKHVKVLKEERDLIELRNERRDYFTRNAYTWNKVMSLKSDLAKSSNKIRDLHEQLSYEQASKNREVSEAMAVAYKQAESKAITLRRMMERQFGSAIISRDFDGTLKDIMNDLQYKESDKLINDLRVLTSVMENLTVKFGNAAKEQGADVDLKDFDEFMKNKEEKPDEKAEK